MGCLPGQTAQRRLEQDLHDGAQQSLLAVAVRLGVLRARATDPAAIELIEAARADLRRALRELRDLARGIHPAALTAGGLLPALEAVADRLPIPVELDVPDRRRDPAVESALYFVACEALTNAVKHAGGCTARVRVVDRPGRVYVEITDTGRGSQSLAEGHGLQGLRERLHARAGTLEVGSVPGAGTCIRAELPCG